MYIKAYIYTFNIYIYIYICMYVYKAVVLAVHEKVAQ